MEPEHATADDVVLAWKDAVQAAELAERLVLAASAQGDLAGADDLPAAEVLSLAGHAQHAADAAARTAQDAVERAAEVRERGTPPHADADT